MKKYFDKAIDYFIYLAGGAGLSTLLWIVLAIPVRMIIKNFENKTLIELVITTIIFAVIVMVVMCFCGYKKGYKNCELSVKNSVVSMMIACAIHFIYSALFQFAVYTTAPSFYLGAVIYHVTVKPWENVPLPIIYRIMTLWLFYLLYIIAVLIGEWYGVKKRLKDRQKLISKKDHE